MQIFFTPTNFQARFLRKEPVSRLSENGEYKPSEVSILEIELNKSEDINSLQNTARTWGDEAYFSYNIADDAKILHNKNPENMNTKFYIATTQPDNFNKLDNTKIVGMAETEMVKNNRLELRLLQVTPDSVRSLNNKPCYKGIGRSLIRTLKSQKQNKTIYLQAMFSAANFYKKMGFELYDPKNFLYIWRKFKPKH